MTNKKDRKKGLKQQAHNKLETGAGDEGRGAGKKTPIPGDTDTAPEEFIAPDVDIDEPLDGEVRNDAVLRGEDHANDKALNSPAQGQQGKKMR